MPRSTLWCAPACCPLIVTQADSIWPLFLLLAILGLVVVGIAFAAAGAFATWSRHRIYRERMRR